MGDASLIIAQYNRNRFLLGLMPWHLRRRVVYGQGYTYTGLNDVMLCDKPKV